MFWKRFYYLCEKKGLKPNKVGKDIDISSGVITKWKNGTIPNGETLIKIADYLDCSVDYLLGRTDTPNETQLINDENNDIDVPAPQLYTSMYAIGYVDILGASKMMESENSDVFLNNIRVLFDYLLILYKKINLISSNSLKIKFFSDNIILAIKTDERSKYKNAAILIQLLSAFQFLAFDKYGYLIRGYVGISNLYIDNTFVFGSGIVTAHKTEDGIANYPRIIFNSDIAEYMNNVYSFNSDIAEYINSAYSFSQFVKCDSDGMYYINYIIRADKNSGFYIYSNINNLINIINKKIKEEKETKVLQKLHWTRNYFISYLDENSIALDDNINAKDDKYKKTDSYAQSVHDFDNALDITPLFEKYKVNKD